MAPSSKKAILFGAIGAVVETSEIQRQAFNRAFADAGLAWDWDAATYRRLLQKPGGAQRIRAYADAHKQTVDAEALHAAKSHHFQRALDEGVRLRLGVYEIITAARAHGVKLGFVTTTSTENVNAILLATNGLLDRSDFDFVGHTGMVVNGKPDPEIYKLALDKLGVAAYEAVAIEDTPASAEASVAAGIETIGFQGAYAADNFPKEVMRADDLTLELVGLKQPTLSLAS